MMWSMDNWLSEWDRRRKFFLVAKNSLLCVCESKKGLVAREWEKERVANQEGVNEGRFVIEWDWLTLT